MGPGPRKLPRIWARADALVVGLAVVSAYLVTAAATTAASNGFTRYTTGRSVPAALGPGRHENDERKQRPERA
jgi:hypothetical protein